MLRRERDTRPPATVACMDADDLPPLDPSYASGPGDPHALAKLDAPRCDACGSLAPMRPAGPPERPYWQCSGCEAVRIA